MEITEYLDRGKSPYQVVAVAKERLLEAGFHELTFDEDFVIDAGGRYFVSPYPTVLFGFTVAKDLHNGSMHIACAHTDFPCLKLKSHPEMTEEGNPAMVRVNVECYGGLLKKTWFDRPLGVAGKVILKTENPYIPREVLFDSEMPWCILPSLAPHLDKDIEKKEVDVQKEMLPLFLIWRNEKPCSKQMLIEALAQRLEVNADDILDYDLYLYNAEPACFVGFDSAMISSARIDNIASVAALIEGLINGYNTFFKSKREKKCEILTDFNVIALFDNEEIGSRSKQGADSMLLSWITEKILESPLCQGIHYKNAMAKSLLLSVDGAHALHPNYTEKSDPSNKVFMGGGIVLKTSATQRYVTDSRASAIVAGLCQREGLPYQKQVNRSGLAGGQTLGPITSSYLPIVAADIGVPMLAMHSAKELCHKEDYEALKKLMEVWFG